MTALLKVLGPPIVLLNLLGGIVSGIWLAIFGQWGSIGVGVLIIVVGGVGISLALMPSTVLFDAPAAHFENRGRRSAAYFFAFLSVLYTYVVMTVWCVCVLVYFVNRAEARSLIPTVVWSYGVAMAPWSWLAQKDQGNWASGVSTFFGEVGYIVMMLMVLLLRVTVADAMMAFAAVMVIGLIVQFKMLVTMQRLMRESSAG